MITINIDKNAGFCFGVDEAIKTAEKELEDKKNILCLGDIVHNDLEVSRLKTKGLTVLSKQEFSEIKNTTVLFRAHGEHPKTYKIAKQNNIKIIDATCPIVVKLQKKVLEAYKKGRENEQIVIFGKTEHPEAISLSGQINDKAIIIENIAQITKINPNNPITIFSQTTMSKTKYEEIVSKINSLPIKYELRFNKTVCPQVANRDKDLELFSKENDVIIFVSGKKSSNGNVLFQICKNNNNNSYFISDLQELKKEWFVNKNTCGISGATSTPISQINEVKKLIEGFQL